MAQKTSEKGGQPFDPNRILGMTYFISTIGVGIWLALNWKRLGKPPWVGPTLVLAGAVPFLSIGLVVGLFFLLEDSEFLWAMFAPVMAAFGANIGFVWALARLQNSGYKVLRQQGQDALLAHEYNFRGAVSFFLAITGVGTLIGVVLAFLSR